MPLNIILTFIFGLCSAQIKIQGIVIDARTEIPIPSAQIKPSDGTMTILSDADGHFILEYSQDPPQIEVNHDSYEARTVTPEKDVQNIMIRMYQTREETPLDQVVVTGFKRKKYKNKEENPAYPILKKLWEHKKKNGLYLYKNYQYDRYEKTQIDLTNIDDEFKKKSIFKDFEFIFDKIDTSSFTGQPSLPIYLNESVYKVYGQNRPAESMREELEASKTSGFEDNTVLPELIKDTYKKYDIYDNTINFFNKSFIGPLSSGGFFTYDYQLVDSTLSDEKLTYRIKFWPKTDNDFAFKGEVWINDGTFAVKKIRMRTNKDMNVNFVKGLYLEQEFDVQNDSVFLPRREYVLLDLSLLDKQKDAKGAYLHRTRYYRDFEFDLPPKGDRFYEKAYTPDLKGLNKDDTYWEATRAEKLNAREAGIYETLDRLQKVPKFRRMVLLTEALYTGYLKVGNVGLGNLYNTFGFNQVEGFRLRLGARTYFSQNDFWRLQGYAAYGFKDRKIKYDLIGKWMIYKPVRWIVGAAYKSDIEQLGLQSGLGFGGPFDNSIAASSLFIQGKNNKLSHVNQARLFTSVEPWKNIRIGLASAYQDISSANPKHFKIDYLHDGLPRDQVKNFKLVASLIFKPGAKYVSYGIDRRLSRNIYHPTFVLEYTRGLRGFLKSDFNYDQIRFHYNQPVMIPYTGRLNVIFNAGKIFGTLPLSLLLPISGNQSYALLPGAFSQLNYYEFVTDTYITLSLKHHFEGRIFKWIPLINKLDLRETVFGRGAWGSISEKNKRINDSKMEYFAPDTRIYYEYGFGIENIGYGNLRPFYIDFAWRGNYLDQPNVRKFGVNVGARFSF